MLPREHLDIARQFLVASDAYTVAEAPLVKSEMLWCAAAHCVKAAANQYGWTNVSHYDLFQVIRRVAQELPEPRLQRNFHVASNLHRNMYEGHLTASNVVNYGATVHRFVNRMAAILREYPQLPRR